MLILISFKESELRVCLCACIYLIEYCMHLKRIKNYHRRKHMLTNINIYIKKWSCFLRKCVRHISRKEKQGKICSSGTDVLLYLFWHRRSPQLIQCRSLLMPFQVITVLKVLFWYLLSTIFPYTTKKSEFWKESLLIFILLIIISAAIK